ncbi:MAG: hypothetical protein ACYST6_06560 [Planctomycetota bacterium]|jgi:putative Mn2+ efflux pump MntP
MLSTLAELVGLNADNGQIATNSPVFMGVFRILLILIIPAGILAVLLGVFCVFYKKRLEHKQIMTAIEKGIPLSDLRPAKPAGSLWIRNLTAGIGLVILAAGFLKLGWDAFERWIGREPLPSPGPSEYLQVVPFVLGVILLAFGVSRFLRGLLQWKADRTALALDKGVSLAELERSKAITSISIGLGMLSVSVGFLYSFLEPLIRRDYYSKVGWMRFGLFFGIGVAFLVRGLMLRKSQRPHPPVEKHPNWMRNLAIGIALLIPVPAFLLFGRNSFWAWVFYHQKNLPFADNFMVVLFISGLILPAFGIFYILRAILQRKAERRAFAIEKGIPLSELESSAWITNISIGVGLFVLSLPLLLNFWEIFEHNKRVEYTRLVPLMLFWAVALGFLIRGLFLRKAERQARLSDGSNAGEKETAGGTSNLENRG